MALAILTVYLVWGTTYLAIRFAVAEIPPFLAAGIRFLLAGGLLFGFQRLRGAPAPTGREWRNAALTGLLLAGVNMGCLNWAETRVSSSVAAIAVATIPVWMSLFEIVLGTGGRPSARMWAGMALGLGGVAVMAASRAWGSVDPIGLAALTAAAILWSLGSILTKRLHLPRSHLLAAGMQMICGSISLLLASLAWGEPGQVQWAAVSPRALGALVYLILFGSIIAFSAYTWLIHHAPAAVVGSYAFVNPVVAVAVGAWIGNEGLTPPILAAGVLIVAGAATLNLRNLSPSPRAGAPNPVASAEPTGNRL